MKKSLIIGLLGLTACGNFHSNVDQEVVDQKQSAQLAVLEADYNRAMAMINNLQDQIGQLAKTIYDQAQALAILANSQQAQSSAVTDLTNSQANLLTQLNTLNATVMNQQVQLNQSLVDIARLNGYDDVVAVVTPCGVVSGIFNESLLKLKDGNYLAYFENNGNRFLTLLLPGNFRTTDSKSCNFTLSSDGTLSW